jgi:amino acid transporter, AAT family
VILAAFRRFCAAQGWPSVIPRFSAVNFLSFYIELLVMALMYFVWLVIHRVLRPPRPPPLATQQPTSSTTPAASPRSTMRQAARPSFFDFVDLSRVDLYHDEHEDEPFGKHEDEDEVRARRLRGPAGWAWALYYYIVA